jgi:hypothetical protein
MWSPRFLFLVDGEIYRCQELMYNSRAVNHTEKNSIQASW